MPRLTSFGDDADLPPSAEKTWEIRTEGHSTFLAVLGDQSFELGHDPLRPGKHKLEISWNRSTQIHNYDLLIGDEIHRIVIKSLSTTEVAAYPFTVTVKLHRSGYSIAMEGVGEVVYRPSWKDSDTARNVVGFIDCNDFTNEEWEQAMVWLIGSLALINFPNMLD